MRPNPLPLGTFVLVLFMNCNSGKDSPQSAETAEDMKVETPPAEPIELTLSTSIEGSVIYFTRDGSLPTVSQLR